MRADPGSPVGTFHPLDLRSTEPGTQRGNEDCPLPSSICRGTAHEDGEAASCIVEMRQDETLWKARGTQKPQGRSRKDRSGGPEGTGAGGVGGDLATGPGGVFWEETSRIRKAQEGRMEGRPRMGRQ